VVSGEGGVGAENVFGKVWRSNMEDMIQDGRDCTDKIEAISINS
jgi:predicted HAD superfamily Cof-like phosphohydrolase